MRTYSNKLRASIPWYSCMVWWYGGMVCGLPWLSARDTTGQDLEAVDYIYIYINIYDRSEDGSNLITLTPQLSSLLKITRVLL